tara:strand:+ start:3141 stop:4439 length:1299 start_codon:yes stop_codon:yes gene_type:complete
MDRLRIIGGQTLSGSVRISGAKNAALPLMAASLLTDQTLILRNVPKVADIETMAQLLAELGLDVSDHWENRSGPNMEGSSSVCLALSGSGLESVTASYELVRKMRASVLVLGPLLARLGYACVSMPGGCAIGPRPVDLHVAGLRQLGATILLKDGYIEASAPKGLRGAVIQLPVASVGATENLMMAASLADGDTIISNAACEPEVGDLAECLVKMGASISGVGTQRLEISGVSTLRGTDYTVVPDRIESGTYAIVAGITGGTLDLLGARIEHMQSVADSLTKVGVELTKITDGVRAARVSREICPVTIETEPYPGFPTDMQAQLMALTTLARGVSTVRERIFENRFMHVNELARLGADISIKGNTATVVGVSALNGAPVMATDLRASVSLLVAGLAAQGETVINRVYHLDRGYESIVEKLVACGAIVERLPE